jgi:ABC-type nitrate/sulfonate/bicarbonate transport system substrate-binding protein
VYKRQSYEGWLYAINHPEEAIDIILKKYNTRNLTRKHLEYEAEQTIKLITAGLKDPKYFGSFNKEQWNEIIKLLYENKQIRKMVSYDDVVDDSVINEVIEGR